MKKELTIKIIIIIIILLITGLTSFRTGERAFKIEHLINEKEEQSVKSNVSRWYFNARVIMGNEVINVETH